MRNLTFTDLEFDIKAIIAHSQQMTQNPLNQKEVDPKKWGDTYRIYWNNK